MFKLTQKLLSLPKTYKFIATSNNAIIGKVSEGTITFGNDGRITSHLIIGGQKFHKNGNFWPVEIPDRDFMMNVKIDGQDKVTTRRFIKLNDDEVIIIDYSTSHACAYVWKKEK